MELVAAAGQVNWPTTTGATGSEHGPGTRPDPKRSKAQDTKKNNEKQRFQRRAGASILVFFMFLVESGQSGTNTS